MFEAMKRLGGVRKNVRRILLSTGDFDVLLKPVSLHSLRHRFRIC